LLAPVFTLSQPAGGWDGGQLLTAYGVAYLPGLLFQFLSTNWWEEIVWMGFFQAPLQQRYGPMRVVLITTPFFALEHISLAFGGSRGCTGNRGAAR